jgi:hypothetical protein
VLSVNRLSKTALSTIELFGGYPESEALVTILEKLALSLSLATIKDSGLLWKYAGVITLRTQHLWDIKEQFTAINCHSSYWKLDPAQWFTLPNIYTSPSSKRNLIEGVSTLYYLNDQQTPDSGLMDAIQAVAVELQQTSPLPEVKKSLAAIEYAQTTFEKILVWPIYDSMCLYQEMILVSELYGMINGDLKVSLVNKVLL